MQKAQGASSKARAAGVSPTSATAYPAEPTLRKPPARYSITLFGIIGALIAVVGVVMMCSPG